jgi:hypothetical protein
MDCGYLCIAQLSFPEQLLVWAIRQWAGGRENWPGIECEFRRACRGASGVIAARALGDMVGLLAASARRPLRCLPLDRPEVSGDEAAIIALVAASQANDRWAAESGARDLMAACMAPVLLESVAVLGAALAAAGRDLPARYALPAPGTTRH